MLRPRMESSYVGCILFVHRRESALESGFNMDESTMLCAGGEMPSGPGMGWGGAECGAGGKGNTKQGRSVH